MFLMLCLVPKVTLNKYVIVVEPDVAMARKGDPVKVSMPEAGGDGDVEHQDGNNMWFIIVSFHVSKYINDL